MRLKTSLVLTFLIVYELCAVVSLAAAESPDVASQSVRSCRSVPLVTEWLKDYGSHHMLWASETSGGHVFWSNVPKAGRPDEYGVQFGKVDLGGSLLSSHSMPGVTGAVYPVEAPSGAGYYVLAEGAHQGGNSDLELTKYTPGLEVEWQQRFGGENEADQPFDIAVDPKLGVFMAGWNAAFAGELVRSDLGGSRQWMKLYTYGSSGDALQFRRIQLYEGRLFVSGIVGLAKYRRYLAEIAPENGRLIWETNELRAGPLFLVQGGEIRLVSAVAGLEHPDVIERLVVARTTLDGVLKTETFLPDQLLKEASGAVYSDLRPRTLLAEPDGGMLIVGTAASGARGVRDMFLVRIDVQGAVVWWKIIEAPKYARPTITDHSRREQPIAESDRWRSFQLSSVEATSDGGLLISGGWMPKVTSLWDRPGRLLLKLGCASMETMPRLERSKPVRTGAPEVLPIGLWQ